MKNISYKERGWDLVMEYTHGDDGEFTTRKYMLGAFILEIDYETAGMKEVRRELTIIEHINLSLLPQHNLLKLIAALEHAQHALNILKTTQQAESDKGDKPWWQA